MRDAMTRRRFVKTAAAAASALAAPDIIPASAFGANDKIAIGCIGVGTRGRKNMDVFLGLIAEIAARLETKLAWDPKEERFVGNDDANGRIARPMHNGWRLQATGANQGPTT